MPFIKQNATIGQFVAKVTAYPANATSEIYYSFLGAGDASRDYENFNIDPLTGEITVATTLDFETKKIYNVSRFFFVNVIFIKSHVSKYVVYRLLNL